MRTRDTDDEGPRPVQGDGAAVDGPPLWFPEEADLTLTDYPVALDIALVREEWGLLPKPRVRAGDRVREQCPGSSPATRHREHRHGTTGS